MTNGSNGLHKPTPAETPVEFTYTLARPIKVRGKEFTTLTVRRPIVRDLIAADRQPGPVASTAALVAACADMSVADFGYVDGADFRNMLARGTALGFFAVDGASGETSSI